jgi:hypothetical protein
MKNNFIRDAQVDFADPKTLISQPVVIADMNTEKTTAAALDFKAEFSITIEKDGTMHALCGWFDIDFSGAGVDTVKFSTSCMTKGTHWKQTMFVFSTPLKVKAGDVVSGLFTCVKSLEHHRELKVTIDWNHGETKGTQMFNVR